MKIMKTLVETFVGISWAEYLMLEHRKFALSISLCHDWGD